MKTLELKLTLEQVNLILESLGQMPYQRVYELVESIQRQAGPQLQDMKEAADSSSGEPSGDAPAETED